MLTTILVVFIILCILSVLYWGVNQLNLPPTLKVGIYHECRASIPKQ